MMFTCVRCLSDTRNDDDMCAHCREETSREAEGMIDAKLIPDEVVEAAVKAEYEHHFRHSCKKWPEDCYEKEREGWRINQRLAIAAGLAAWPDAFITKYSEGAPAFNIPLKETPNAE